MYRPSSRKRSTAITLMLAGTLAGCGEPVPQRDAYQSLDDCVRDWRDPAQCEPVRDGRFAPSYYYGPHYYGNSYGDNRPRPSAHAMSAVYTQQASVKIARGGFGSSARSFFSGG